MSQYFQIYETEAEETLMPEELLKIQSQEKQKKYGITRKVMGCCIYVLISVVAVLLIFLLIVFVSIFFRLPPRLPDP